MLELQKLLGGNVLFLDTETTGLYWYQNNKPFLIILSSERFSKPILLEVTKLTIEEVFILRKLFSKDRTIVAHNAKFDVHMMHNIGFDLSQCTIYDTMTMHRHYINDLDSYSLDNLTGKKDKSLAEYIKKNNCKEVEVVRNKKRVYKPLYFMVPEEILFPYARQDVLLVQQLYNTQQEVANTKAFEIDKLCTSVIFQMERRGIKLDIEYTTRAMEYELDRAKTAREDFRLLTGFDFVDSGKSLGKIFTAIGVRLPITEKGNQQTSKVFLKSLAKKGNIIAEKILEIREANKMANTYYGNYLRFLNKKTEKIHANFHQFGAETGRMSCVDPNIQNVKKDKKGLNKYNPRKCFIPDNEDYKLVSIDFQAQEMRCFLDAAGEQGVINDIMINNLDLHMVTANLMGVSRDDAKGIGFGIIYGEGVNALSETLKTSVEAACHLRDLFFAKLPNAARLIRSLQMKAKHEGFIETRYGNILRIPQEYAYKATNYFIQGTCAMHTKYAAIKVHNFLSKNSKSWIVALIHDEILIHMHKDDFGLLPEIQRLMISAYPQITLPMDCNETIYLKNWCGEVLKK
jgi:DNA polymerase-1